MIEKILFEYYTTGSEYESLLKIWDRMTITSKNIYICGDTRQMSCIELEDELKKSNKKKQLLILEDVSEIYNDNLEIISKHEELKNNILKWLSLKKQTI